MTEPLFRYGDVYRDTTDNEVLMFVAGSRWFQLVEGNRDRAPEKDHPMVKGDTPADSWEDWEKVE